MTIKIDSKIVHAEVVKNTSPKESVNPPKPLKRPQALSGKTYKLKNSADNYNLYVTVNYFEDKPFEIFIDGSHTDATQWVKALARQMSAMLRSTDENLSLEFIARELMMIHSDQGYHTGGKGGFVSGIVQHIGKVLLGISKEDKVADVVDPPVQKTTEVQEIEYLPQACPECGDTTMVLKDGCPTCLCGYSKCG